MLNLPELKSWLHRDLSQLNKLLLILAFLDKPRRISDISEAARQAGLRLGKGWNPSASLARSKGLAIRTPQGWEITEAGKLHLLNLGVTKISPAAVHVATDLRAQLPDIASDDTRQFVEEAVKCYEAELYRSAIVMSWDAAVAVLHSRVHTKHLAAFNVEAKRADSYWKPARTTDDLGRMNESEILERIAAISIIGKNVKKELKDCLDRRNGCSHRNSLKIGRHAVAHHLETLLLNVLKVL